MRKRASFKRGGLWPACGHKKTKANTTVSRQCRECNREQKRRARREAREAREAVQRAPLIVESRGPRYAILMAEAKAEYLAALEREKERLKGGRPKSGKGGQRPMGNVGRPNRFANVHEDPRDALLNALGSFSGAA